MHGGLTTQRCPQLQIVYTFTAQVQEEKPAIEEELAGEEEPLNATEQLKVASLSARMVHHQARVTEARAREAAKLAARERVAQWEAGARPARRHPAPPRYLAMWA